MPCFALQNRGGKLNWLDCHFVVDGCSVAFGAALIHHITGTGFAAPTLGGNTKFELDFVKAHARMRVASDFAI